MALCFTHNIFVIYDVNICQVTLSKLSKCDECEPHIKSNGILTSVLLKSNLGHYWPDRILVRPTLAGGGGGGGGGQTPQKD